MEQEFSLTSEMNSNCLVITTSGYINNKGGEAIAQEFGKHFANGTKHVIINLAQSKVVNSIGMSFLIEIIEQLEEAGGKMIFTNVDAGVDKMLSIMGLFNFAGKEKTVQDAVNAFST
jgi:anti-anti-sigma factor